ncbi:MAG: hypothetical protein HYR96_00280 [Deltaproteobacteria bacterium]|nr:hypothetical protein [Deltaproteobacteria bacterium]
MARFHEREYEGAIRKRAVAYEWKAPEESQLTTAWEKILETVDIAQLLPLTIYVEMAMTESSLQRVDQLRELNRTTPFTFGLKVRTGGVTIPTPTQLAQAIEGAAKAGLKFKATQGLHEVFTHSNAFGFLNLFAALNLRFHSSLTTANLIACLQDDEAKNFTFTPDRFSWRGHLLSTTQIEAARLKHAGAFGSCSLDEPSDSLKKWFGAHL